MADFCLPVVAAGKLLTAIRDGTVTPDKLHEMTNAERRSFLEPIVGKENVTDVNTLIESKLLSKDYQRGMVTAVKQLLGEKSPLLNDAVSKINRMNESILNPETREAFLADLAAKKVGAEVTPEEASKISEMAKEAQAAKEISKNTSPLSKERLDYGRKSLSVTEYIDSLKPKGRIFTATNILNIPKTTLTSVLHFSASGVQLWGMISRKSFLEGFVKQFKYFAKPSSYRDLQATIIGHPDYELMKSSGLGLTKIGDKLSEREEAIQSSLLQHIPYVKHLVNASSRAFTGILNYVRFQEFVNMTSAARLHGEDIRIGSQPTKDIADMINNFTGRGHLPFNLDRITPELNTVFFSPRKIMGTVNMFNPAKYLDPRISRTARIGALRNLMGSILITASVLELTHLTGANVNTNPISTDFLKMKYGKTTLDMTGGNAIYIRLLARLFTGKFISGSGKESSLTSGQYGAQTRLSTLESFVQNKFAPIPGAIADWMVGRNPVGQPVTITSELKDKLTPIVASDFYNLITNDPHNSAVWLPSIAALFGVQMNTDVPKVAKKP